VERLDAFTGLLVERKKSSILNFIKHFCNQCWYLFNLLKSVAVKIIPVITINDTTFLQDILVLPRVENEYIIKYIEHFQDKYSFFIVTEYCPVSTERVFNLKQGNNFEITDSF
jgi:serine/threonine protein kinase